MNDPKNPDKRKPAVENDEESSHVNQSEFAGPEGQVETDLPIETDGGEISGRMAKGEGRKPVGGAS